ncbi:uncharacterized protein I206_103717 [Kwoniella pini CBS 10737]|uniref:Mesaconyl-C4 CoA hydratase n=1 Tax=Kwoniella pini CBS 10737 TaxID=1296096 RepID=A0A1B9I8U2_9TREE|nr:uncharacterized protein I206_01282 [Kwoniella pini CBS 10737]OCF51998.1 hypothetical protein I206_01282 [Kwoniella pini CBS 10737]
MLKDLGKDGSATEYNAPSPYTRRMWAGGSIQWSNNNSLKIGDDVTQIVTIPKVEFKKDMIFVNQQLLIYPGIRSNSQSSKKNDDSWSIKEIRTHVFRKEPTFNTVHQIASSEKSTYSQKSSRTIQPIHSFKYIPDSTLLFLYSALTNNPHKVHYDYEWTIKEEGHEKPLVHGPLTATLLVELAGQLKPDKKIKEFKYRATNPMTIDREIRLSASRSTSKEGPLDTSTFELIAEQSSKIGMKAFASFH